MSAATATAGGPGAAASSSGRASAASTADARDQLGRPVALLAVYDRLLGSGSGSPAMWAGLPSVGRTAILSFILDGNGSGSNDAADIAVSAPVAAVVGKCRSIMRTERYRNLAGMTLWTYDAGFAFCYDGSKITYVSKAVVRGGGHLGWRYLGLLQPATFIGGAGFAFVEMTAQGAMEICVPFLPALSAAADDAVGGRAGRGRRHRRCNGTRVSGGGRARGGADTSGPGALVALALAGLVLAAIVPPLLGVAVAAGGLTLARRSPRHRVAGLVLVGVGLALAAYLVLVLWGSGSGSTSVSLAP